MRNRRPESIDHRCVASELGQHRNEHARVCLAQVGPQFLRINIAESRRRFGVGRHDSRVSRC